MSKRGENKFEVFVAARDLAVYTATICTNTNAFPGRFRAVTNAIIGTAWDIARDVWTANGIYVGRGSAPGAMAERVRLETKAISGCKELLFQQDMCYQLFPDCRKKLSTWAGKTANVKDLITKWRESEKRKLAPRD